MVTCKDVRKLELSLPDTEEREHWERTSFRVKNKTFSLTGWEHQGWTAVQLTNIALHHFKKLMVTAWKNVAPKRVAAAYDG